MKKLSLLILLVLFSMMFSSCKDEPTEPTQELHLTGTKWKLVGFYDVEKQQLTKAEPKDCEECYTLYFDTDSTLTGKTYLNEVIGKYRHINYSLNSLEITNFVSTSFAMELFDSELYIELMNKVQSFYYEDKKLKLFCNDNKTYLVFKLKE